MNSRASVGLCILVSLVFGYLCISTRAPMIEDDIATRCRELLTSRQIKPEGISVSGRDVLLSGVAGTPIVSEQARTLLEHVSGVRTVKIQLVTADGGFAPGAAKQTEPADSRVRAVQDVINRVLQTQPVEFQTDSATLTPASKVVLDSIVLILSHAPTLRCEIRGNSKASSNAQRDWMMTLQRALATEEYLVNKGIADWRMSAQVFRAGNGAGSSEVRQIEFVVKER